MLEDALHLQHAGCFSLVIASVPARLAALISQRLEIPTIGIGAGPGCDGQVLVTHDLLGFFDRFTPRFVKQYANLHSDIACALTAYRDDVTASTFPAPEHAVEMPDEEWDALVEEADD